MTFSFVSYKFFFLSFLSISFSFQGWETGIVGMKKGGRRFLIVPPGLAYGEQGMGDKVPPNSTLIFEIEMIRVSTIHISCEWLCGYVAMHRSSYYFSKHVSNLSTVHSYIIDTALLIIDLSLRKEKFSSPCEMVVF